MRVCRKLTMKTLGQYVKCVQITSKNLETVGGICSKLK